MRFNKTELLKLQQMLFASDKELDSLAKVIIKENKDEIYKCLLQILPKEQKINCESFYKKYNGKPERWWPDFYTDFIKRLA